jgi:hypothetical protein
MVLATKIVLILHPRYRLTDEVDLSCLSDFDSVIGTVPGRFPISPDATFNYYPLADAWHTLNSNLHIPHATIVRQERGQGVGGEPRVSIILDFKQRI